MTGEEISFWAFHTNASVSVSRTSMLLALVSLNEPTISVNGMKTRIGHGAAYSVHIGFEPFVASGIVKETESLGRVRKDRFSGTFPEYIVEREILKETIEGWERLELVSDSPVLKYVLRNCVDLNDVHMVNPDYNNRPWMVRNTVRRYSDIAIQILYLKERCKIRFDNWCQFLTAQIPTIETLNMVRQEYIANEVTDWELETLDDLIQGYTPVNPNGSFDVEWKNWYTMQEHSIYENDYYRNKMSAGHAIGIPGVSDKEMFNDEGNGSLICQ